MADFHYQNFRVAPRMAKYLLESDVVRHFLLREVKQRVRNTQAIDLNLNWLRNDN